MQKKVPRESIFAVDYRLGKINSGMSEGGCM
jgi:hypothetical protein